LSDGEFHEIVMLELVAASSTGALSIASGTFEHAKY